MKLRIRSTATKETIRVETPDPCTLSHLKTLIAAKLSPSTPAESIRLSLNRTDELLSASSDDSLHALGLTSGDLLFFSLSSGLETSTLVPTLVDSGECSNLAAVSPAKAPNSASETPSAEQSDTDRQEIDQTAESSKVAQIPESEDAKEMGEAPAAADQQEDSMEVDPETVLVERRTFSIPGFLQKVMEAEKGEAAGILGRLVITVHAALLESGFVVTGSSESRLPERWAESVAVLSVRYTVPELLETNDGKDVKPAILKFSLMGNYATVYGFLSGDRSDFYRLCFDLSKLAPLLSSDMNSLSNRLEKEVFELWKLVKDGLSLPLLIDICLKNGLPSPPCFMLLPTDLKIKILEFVPGVDVAKFGCTCSELRYLSSNDKLWKQKLVEEFGLLNERELVGSNWKEKYTNCWVKKSRAKKMMVERDRVARRGSDAPRFNPFRPQRFPVIGGDYDLFPGGRTPMAPRFGFPARPYRRNFSPDCNLGGV